jgi:hypothetical protein
MNGILLTGPDELIESRAKGAKLAVVISDDYALPFEKTLIVEPGTRVPFDLLPAAWHFLDRWDAAVPLWRYGVLAQDIGTATDQAPTRAVIRDLRVLLHATELLFVRRNEAGESLVKTWRGECAAGGDPRLAFLRALYQIKPRLCVLPTNWLAANVSNQIGPIRSHGSITGQTPPHRALVSVELAPGRFVKVYAGDEEKALAQFAQQKNRRK